MVEESLAGRDKMAERFVEVSRVGRELVGRGIGRAFIVRCMLSGLHVLGEDVIVPHICHGGGVSQEDAVVCGVGEPIDGRGGG